MGLIYLDSCICIYATEQNARDYQQALEAIASRPDLQFAISHLVMAECLVGPLKTGNSFMAQDYEALFQRLIILELNETIYRHAAQLMAGNRLKMPDALHLACAQFHGCEALWTNDNRLSQLSGGLAVSILSNPTTTDP